MTGPTLQTSVTDLLGVDVVAETPVSGGDICTAARLDLADGRTVFAKTHPDPPAGFFGAEVRGLAWLAAAGPDGVPTPAVLAHHEHVLVLEWIEPGTPTVAAAERFGRALAATHAAGAEAFGAVDGAFLGVLSIAEEASARWSGFWAERRLAPYVRTARDLGSLGADDAAAVDEVIGRIDELAGPAEPPARLHGDLWSGNVVWAADGQPRVVDPAPQGGHRETDLAMLALFGLPHLDRVLAAYGEMAPLADGWRERVALHQLHPLLVHAVIFGRGYGARAGAAARVALGSPVG